MSRDLYAQKNGEFETNHGSIANQFVMDKKPKEQMTPKGMCAVSALRGFDGQQLEHHPHASEEIKISELMEEKPNSIFPQFEEVLSSNLLVPEADSSLLQEEGMGKTCFPVSDLSYGQWKTY
ncbi:hypothetical protein VI817_006237 [Penicillium citrinum]|nr:hypothetical protein VI817_006237 [Penicillium citrinum]